MKLASVRYCKPFLFASILGFFHSPAWSQIEESSWEARRRVEIELARNNAKTRADQILNRMSEARLPVADEAATYFSGPCTLLSAQDDPRGGQFGLLALRSRDGVIEVSWNLSVGEPARPNPFLSVLAGDLSENPRSVYPLKFRQSVVDHHELYVEFAKTPEFVSFIRLTRDQTTGSILAAGTSRALFYCELTKLEL